MRFVLLLIAFVLTSCGTRKIAKEKEYVYDTIEVVRDSIVEIEKKVIISKPIKSEVFIPCPEDDEKGSSGAISSGNNIAQWVYDEDKNGFTVKLDCDSTIMELKKEIIRLNNENKSVHKTIQSSESEIERVKSNFWQGV